MNSKSSQCIQKKSTWKSPANLGFIICFIAYGIIITLGFSEKLSEKWIGWIDIGCLALGLITYIADTSGFLEKKPEYMAPARTITLASISLSLSIHLFTQTNVYTHFNWFVAFAWVLLVIIISWVIKKLLEE